jgi:putative sugar O-methyltransferase
MNRYPDLFQASKDMLLQDEVYRPTLFWSEASEIIERELLQHGVERFRRLPSTLNFFVPTYGALGNTIRKEDMVKVKAALEPASSKAQQALAQFLSGELAAIGDYRVLMAGDNLGKVPSLDRFSESTFGEPVEQFVFDGRRFSRSSLNYLLGLLFLKKHLRDEPLRKVLEVGGGFGTLGEILFSAGLENWRYIDIDIPPTSFIAEHYLRSVFGASNVAGYASMRDENKIVIDLLPPVTVLCSWQIERLDGEVDLFVNFISFQEMEPHVVANYLKHVDRLKARWVLLRNLREGKQLRRGSSSVGVEVQIKSEDYLNLLPRYKLVERNVLPYGYRTVDGFHSELLLLRRQV